jgi:hypothetical protein
MAHLHLRRSFAAAALTLAAGCVHAPDGLKDTHVVGAPSVDRCAAQAGATLQEQCRAERDQALRWVHHLSVDDQICIDGLVPLETELRQCSVRGFVQDTAPEQVKVEIREAPPGSPYKDISDYWFNEQALADIQLRAKGYVLASDPKPPAGN